VMTLDLKQWLLLPQMRALTHILTLHMPPRAATVAAGAERAT
jgi:hypothetical protein